MMNILKKWLGEWKTDEQELAERAAAYDAELSRISIELNRKRKIAIEKLGEKWLMHPSNRVKRKT
jgi:hypothetical protein